MSFVHTSLLFGLALGALPIIIHLLLRRRHKVVRWGAMKYLLAAIEETSRRVQIEDLILLALRVLTIVLLALALARPFVPQPDVPPGPRLAVVLVDNSPSMSSRRGGQSRLDLARAWIKQALRDLPPGSEVAVIPMAGTIEPANPTREIALASRTVDELGLSGRRADPAAAVRAAAATIERSSLINRTVYVVSDFQADDWLNNAGTLGADLRGLIADGRVELAAVQCSDGRTENGTITELERAWRIIKVDTPAQVFGTVLSRRPEEGVGPAELAATLDVNGVKIETRSAALEPNKPARVDFIATLGREGDHALKLTGPPDVCPADDVRYLAVEARDEVRVLCVDGDPHVDEDYRNETFYLRLALSPGSAALLPITAKVVSAADFAREDLKNYDMVVLANVGQIEPTRARDLSTFLRAGQPIVIFLGDMVEPGSYNNTLFSGPDALTTLRLGERIDPPTGEQGGLTVQADSLVGPVMSYFRGGKTDGGLSHVRVEHAYEIDLATAPKSAMVHARLAPGDVPLLVTVESGEGRLAIINASADADWASLAIKPAFVPLMQRLVVWLLEPRSRCQNLAPGQRWRLSLPLSAINATVTIRLPDERTVAVQPTEAVATSRPDGGSLSERAVCVFDQTDQAGFYHASWQEPGGPVQQRLFAVNIDPAEGDLTTIQPDALKELTHGGPVRWFDATAKDSQSRPSRPEDNEWWRYVLLAAAALLAAETYLGRLFSGRGGTAVKK